MANTGYKNVLTLRKYVDGDPTTITKVNVSTDPDYIAPYEDLTACPFGAEPPADDTTMNHTFTDSDGTISNYVRNTVDTEGDTATFNLTISAPSGYYWSSAPTFSSDTSGCTATSSVSSDNTILNVQVSYTQGADSSTATYTYGSTANLSAQASNTINWSSGTSLSVGSTGTSPVTDTITGTLTIGGADRTFRAYVANNFNVANIASISLTIGGTTTVSVSTDGTYGTFYTSSITKAAGTYSYVLTITLNLVTGQTSGSASGGIQNLN